jgi:hypothetical protein
MEAAGIGGGARGRGEGDHAGDERAGQGETGQENHGVLRKRSWCDTHTPRVTMRTTGAGWPAVHGVMNVPAPVVKRNRLNVMMR